MYVLLLDLLSKSYYVLMKNYYFSSLDVLLAMHILAILHYNNVSMQIVKTRRYSLINNIAPTKK